jgi:hypothetical protein
MSAEHEPTDEPEASSEPSPQARQLALIIYGSFICLTIFALGLSGVLFFESMKEPHPVINRSLWSLAGLGTLSAFCAAWLHHWIVNLKMKGLTIEI